MARGSVRLLPQKRMNRTVSHLKGVRTAVREMERQLKKPLPRTSLDYVRFVTHIRFALQRALTGQPIVNPLSRAIRELPSFSGGAHV